MVANTFSTQTHIHAHTHIHTHAHAHAHAHAHTHAHAHAHAHAHTRAYTPHAQRCIWCVESMFHLLIDILLHITLGGNHQRTHFKKIAEMNKRLSLSAKYWRTNALNRIKGVSASTSHHWLDMRHNFDSNDVTALATVLISSYFQYTIRSQDRNAVGTDKCWWCWGEHTNTRACACVRVLRKRTVVAHIPAKLRRWFSVVEAPPFTGTH